RRALAGQGIVAELVIQLAVAGAGGEAQLARGQLDQPALKVGLGDRLTDRRAVLEVGADGLLAVLRDVLPRGGEEVHAGGAGGEVGAEVGPRALGVRAALEAVAEVRRGQQAAGAGEREGPGLPRVGRSEER